MQPFATSLVDALNDQNDRLLSAAETVVESTPSMGPGHYPRATLKQLLNGFCALMKEALEDQSSETYELFIGTAVPAMVADGQTTESLVEASASFGTLIAMDLAAAVPEEHRETSEAWLARFFGRYVADVYRAANDAAESS